MRTTAQPGPASTLANRVQPILRYDLGDSILQRPSPCPCGDPLPAMRVQGRTATVRVDRAIVDLPSGRKLALANGLFEVPDTHPKPSPARTRFRAEGSADAAAELLALERLRDSSNVALDPATTKGAFVAQVALDHTLTGLAARHRFDQGLDLQLIPSQLAVALLAAQAAPRPVDRRP